MPFSVMYVERYGAEVYVTNTLGEDGLGGGGDLHEVLK